MLGEYTNKKMAAASSCQLQNNTMIQTRCYPSSMLCIRLWLKHKLEQRPIIGQLIKNSSNFDEVVKTDNGLLVDGIDASLLPLDENKSRTFGGFG